MQLKNVVIINYHKISLRADIGLTARHPDDFKTDLQLVKDLGFKTITFYDLLNSQPSPTEKLVIITFDDGYKSVAEYALPLMKDLNFKGVVYVPTAFIGKTNDWDVQFGGKKYWHLDEKDLQDLAAHGFEIGSHGVWHRSLKGLSASECFDELVQSKQTIESLVSKPVVSVSYPFSQFNPKILGLSRKAGYQFGVSSIYYKNVASLDGLSVMALRRFNVYRMDSVEVLKKKLKGDFNCLFAYRDWLIQRGSKATVFWQKIFKNEN
ncbi:MAG: polysaccharide deacetylase family protein [Caldisericaceae bacterium]|nr:polysaccharide deacetylase family protein [Caldisericaceae bacterium]